MDDPDVDASTERCRDCSGMLTAEVASGARYLRCPECGLVRMLPFQAWSDVFDHPVPQTRPIAI